MWLQTEDQLRYSRIGRGVLDPNIRRLVVPVPSYLLEKD